MVAFKLSSGIMVIGTVVEQDSITKHIILKRVREMNVRAVPTEGGVPQLMLDMNVPYVFLDDQSDVEFHYMDIHAVPMVPNDVEKQYLSATSGIEMP